MKVTSKKKIAITALTVAAVGLFILVGVLVIGGITHQPEANISVDDLVEMKTLVHKYLNERSRLVCCSDPENNPNIAGAPVIEPSEMSQPLAARQAGDVKKLRAKAKPSTSKPTASDPWTFDNFVTLTGVSGILKEGDDIALIVGDLTYYHVIPAELDYKYVVDGNERYYTFTREGNKWMLKDAEMTIVGESPGLIEPSIKPMEAGTSRVLKEPYLALAKNPEKLVKLDEEATRKIINKWAMDRKTEEALRKLIGVRITTPATTHIGP